MCRAYVIFEILFEIQSEFYALFVSIYFIDRDSSPRIHDFFIIIIIIILAIITVLL